MYSGFNLWNFFDEIGILLDNNNMWFWSLKDIHNKYSCSEQYFKSAADAEQDLITFLKNYEGFRNG